MTTLEATEIVGMLAAAYPAWRPTEETLRLYARLLEPFEAELARTTAMELIYSGREFAPPIGALAEAITINHHRRAGQYLSPEEAWAEVAEQIRSVGFYRQPKFDNRTLERAVAALDWGEICANENIEATRAHLMRVFDRLQREVVREQARILTGLDLVSLPGAAWPALGRKP
jgi:hypothetical protein